LLRFSNSLAMLPVTTKNMYHYLSSLASHP
jgi:hypothetical protein